MAGEHIRRAVVGVDGTPTSRQALRLALDWVAAGGGGVVEAVHVWQTPYVYGPMGGALVTVDRQPVEDAAREVLSAALAGVEVPDGVELQPVLAEGPCAQSLLERAEGADLLAVGTRGRGGFAGLLLGSVTQQCLHHARCPVLAVPEASVVGAG